MAYILASAFFSFLLAKISKRYQWEVYIFLLVFFITPSQIKASKLDYAPSVFTFIYNIIFQQELSMRVLRPLLLSLPFCYFSLIIYSAIKRRLF
tara:strand:+ start:193 stop:474 length:282 start_codon:yes stop_codon:yes gene_type:complete